MYLFAAVLAAVLVTFAVFVPVAPFFFDDGSGVDDTTAQMEAQDLGFTPLAQLGAIPTPIDNPITPEKVELGRLLFFDPRMSGDGSMSCNSCHPSDQGWSVDTAISFGPPGTSHWRNVGSVVNIAYATSYNWEGSKKSLESQNSGAWGGAVAGNLDKALGEERLAEIPDYVERFADIFGTDTPLWDDALRAVATYQRTLVSRNVPFDSYLAGDQTALGDQAAAGLSLFTGKAGCVSCHDGALLSDNGFHALGVPQNDEFLTSPLRQITFRYEQWAKGATEDVYRTTDQDLGRYYVTHNQVDKGKFRTPGLRDVCYTKPYMHNGIFSTLDQVVEFYNNGIPGDGVENVDPLMRPLGLTQPEVDQIVAFLAEGLCGDPVTDTAPELPPYRDGTLPGEER